MRILNYKELKMNFLNYKKYIKIYEKTSFSKATVYLASTRLVNYLLKDKEFNMSQVHTLTFFEKKKNIPCVYFKIGNPSARRKKKKKGSCVLTG